MLSDGVASYTPGLWEKRGGTSRFVGSDYLGTHSKMLDAAGAVASSRQYDAFGVPTSGSDPSPFGFAGSWGYQEDAGGLKLLGHRYYDPSTGRFLTRDPIKDGRNWYAYCGNNPTGTGDPTGLYLLDTAVDVASVVMSADAYARDPSLGNAFWLTVDVAFLVLPLPSVGILRHANSTKAELMRLARVAEDAVNLSHKGASAAARGSRAHKTWRLAADHLIDAAEVSYKNGEVVKYGTPGSVRIDALRGTEQAPVVIYDLKLGGATLSPRRIAEIRKHLPKGVRDKVEIVEIKPTQTRRGL